MRTPKASPSLGHGSEWRPVVNEDSLPYVHVKEPNVAVDGLDKFSRAGTRGGGSRNSRRFADGKRRAIMLHKNASLRRAEVNICVEDPPLHSGAEGGGGRGARTKKKGKCRGGGCGNDGAELPAPSLEASFLVVRRFGEVSEWR